jgi:hypothetical protein
VAMGLCPTPWLHTNTGSTSYAPFIELSKFADDFLGRSGSLKK